MPIESGKQQDLVSTKAIAFKIRLTPELVEAITTSHRIFNQGVNYCLDVLFMLRRNRGWWDGGEFHPNTPLHERVLALASRVNGCPPSPQEEDEIYDDLREVYLYLVPQAGHLFDTPNPKRGNSQTMRGLCNPLAYPNATGLGLASAEDPDPDDRQYTLKMALRRLKRRGLLPLVSRVTEAIGIEGSGGQWEYAMWQLAAEIVLGHETKVAERAAEVQAWEQARERWELEHGSTWWVQAFREYEGNRIAETGGADFCITFRQLKGWKRLRQQWQDSPDRSASDLLRVAHRVQAENNQDWGDHRLYEWLADRPDLWSEDNLVVKWAERNKEFGQRPRSITFTRPDPTAHPQWVRHGTNGATSILYKGNPVTGSITMELLTRSDCGTIRRQDFPVSVEPMTHIFLAEGVSDGLHVSRRNHLGFWARVQFRGTRLQLEHNSDGHLSRAYLMATYEVPRHTRHPALPPDKSKQKPLQVWSDDLLGLGVLSVDLGQRHPAACAVGRIVPPGDGTWPVAGREQALRQERSFLIRSEEVPAALKALRKDLYALRTAILHRTSLHRLGAQVALGGDPGPIGLQRLARLRQAIGEDQHLPQLPAFDPVIAVQEPDRFAEMVKVWISTCDRQLAQQIREFDQGFRRVPACSAAQIPSMDRILLFQEWMKLRRRWLTRPIRWGDKRRAPRGETQVRALADHVNHLREERARKTASVLVTAALGLPREKNQVVRVYEPCHLIVMEELGKYDPRQGRTRNENSRLTNWVHRRVRRYLESYAEPYGLMVWGMYPGYSSRFCGACGSPGQRCEHASKQRLTQLHYRARRYGQAPPNISEGDLRLDFAGELFLCANPNCGSSRRPANADINAALNLLRWVANGRPTLPVKVKAKDGHARAVDKGTRSPAAWTLLVPGVWSPGKPGSAVTGGQELRLLLDSDGLLTGQLGLWLENDEYWRRVYDLAALIVNSRRKSAEGIER